MQPSRAAVASWSLLSLTLAASGCVEDDAVRRAESVTDDRGGATPGRWTLPAEMSTVSSDVHVEIDGSPPGPHDPDNCTGTFEPGAAVLREYIAANFDVDGIGGYHCRAINFDPSKQTSVHGLGRALDVMVPMVDCHPCQANNQTGDQLAHWLIVHAEEIGIQRIIWDRASWQASGVVQTKPYTGSTSHEDHLHIELNLEGAAMQTPWFGDGVALPPPPDLPPVDPCESLPAGGECVGNVVQRCDDDVLEIEDCGAQATCDVSDAFGVAYCRKTNRTGITGHGDDGYVVVAADGGAFALGSASFAGSIPGLGIAPAAPIVAIAGHASGDGYWLAGADGGVFAFGAAPFAGAWTGAQQVIGIAAAPDGTGYWIADARGDVAAFGSAMDHGSLVDLGVSPAEPIVGVASSSAGGLWLAAADGGVFALGAAGFHGSLPAIGVAPAEPIVGMAAHPDGDGYWLVGADGGVFAFGSASYHGGANTLDLAAPIRGVTATSDGAGYWLVAADGGVFAFGSAQFAGAPLAE
jgi:hypothetical protein